MQSYTNNIQMNGIELSLLIQLIFDVQVVYLRLICNLRAGCFHNCSWNPLGGCQQIPVGGLELAGAAYQGDLERIKVLCPQKQWKFKLSN